jgi:DNA-directed RNA polymerase subunit M/transcription elongation factor TFIIS
MKGEVKKCKILDASIETIQGILKKKTTPQVLGTYEYGSLRLTLFGYKDGRAGSENKHELPPPLDDVLLFGDVVLIASKVNQDWKHPVNFSPEQYEKFYNKQFGGFDDVGSEDSDTEEDELEIEAEAEVEAEPEAEEEEEEEEEEEDDEDEEEGIVGDEDEEVEGEEAVVVKKKPSSKKKSTKANLIVQSNTGRAKQQDLLQKNLYEPLPSAKPGFKRKVSDAAEDSKEYNIRGKMMTVLSEKFNKLFKPAQLIEIEQVALYHALVEADKKYIFRHFENPLFVVLYNNAGRSLVANLLQKSYIGNTELYSKVKGGQISIENLRTMNVIDFAPQIYDELREKQLLREENQLEGNKALATDRYTCSRCHKRQCTYYELQKRSADEPMTIFITCVNCNKRWKN